MDEIVYPKKPPTDEKGVPKLNPHQVTRLRAGRCVCCGVIQGKKHRTNCPYKIEEA